MQNIKNKLQCLLTDYKNGLYNYEYLRKSVDNLLETNRLGETDMDLSKEQLIEMYRRMRSIRRFEQEAIKLYRQAQIYGYFHPYIGEEAIAVGSCAAIREDDYIISTHRGHGHCIAKGASLRRMMAELFGKEAGYCRGRGGSMHIANVEEGNLGANGIVGAGMPIAVGAALGNIVKKNDKVVICYFSDGAVNNGVFNESLNLAAIWKLPVIFMLENNQWAVSTPVSYSCAIKDIAKRAEGYSMPGIMADGNNVLEVFEVTKQSVERCRSGGGPTFIEAKTFRRTGHHCNDPAKYYDPEVVKFWEAKDPIDNFKKYLLDNSLCNEQELDKIEQQIEGDIKDAIEFALNSPEPNPEEFLKEMEEKFCESMKVVS